MAITAEEVRVIVDASVDKALNGLRKTDDQTTKLIGSLKKLIGPAALGALAIKAVQVGKEFSALASSAEEVNSKFNTVFKEQAGSVRNWANEYAEAFGQSKTDTLAFLATIQDTLVPLGFARDAASDMSTQIVQLAGDLASFNNLPTADVVRDIQSAIVGNTETLRKYGVVANESAIKQEALNSGLWDGKGAIDAENKAAAILNITLRGTTDAQGDLERTQDSTANVTRRLENSYNDLGIAVGTLINQQLTPFKAILADIVGELAKSVQSTADLQEQMNNLSNSGQAVGDLAKLENDLATARQKLITQPYNQALLETVSALEKAISAEMRRAEAADLALMAGQKGMDLERRRQEAAAQRAAEEKASADALATYLALVEEEFGKTSEGQIRALENEIAMWEEYALTAVNTADEVAAIIADRKEQLAGLTETQTDFVDTTEEDLARWQMAWDSASAGLDEQLENMRKSYEETASSILGTTNAIGEAFGAAIASGDGFAEASKEAAKSAAIAILKTLGERAAAEAAFYTAASLVPFGQANVPAAVGFGAASLAAFTAAGAISAFASGGDFVTSGPQLIMVGDNPGGRERVQVTPQSSPNINGPKDGNVTITILPREFNKFMQAKFDNQEIVAGRR